MTIDSLHSQHERALSAAAGGYWTDWSDEAFERRREVIHDTQRRLKVLSAEDPSLDAQLLARELRLDLQAIDYRLHAFPVNQLMGVPNQIADGMRIPFFLTTRHPLASMEDVDALIGLVEHSESHLRQMAAAVHKGARSGITLPREAIAATKLVIRDSLRGIPVGCAPFPHPLHQCFAEWAAGATRTSAAEVRAAGDRLAAALAGPLRRGYEAIDGALDEMLAGGRASFGVWDLPDGEAFYQHCLERWSGSTAAADSLHELGLAEIERIVREIRPLLDPGIRDLDPAELGERMRCEADACYVNTAAGATAYIERARLLIDMVSNRMEQITTWRPRAALEIRAVEAARQSGALYAEFYPATIDGQQPSLYYVNGGDMSRLPKAELAALTFHEGVPGHHLQLCTTQERSDLAAFRRRPFLYESYCEGWAMYSEQLGCELLADVLSPAEQRGCLTRRLWMAARLCVDTGIHALRWSRDEAMHFFRANTFAPPHMIEQEVDRLSVWPGQATAYHAGYLAFSALRQESRRDQSQSDFHDRLFRLGPVPAGMLAAAFRHAP